jgi:heme/copper-type cytochrome/quinol oxidase subunit 2
MNHTALIPIFLLLYGIWSFIEVITFSIYWEIRTKGYQPAYYKGETLMSLCLWVVATVGLICYLLLV